MCGLNANRTDLRRGLTVLVLLGLFLTLRGYRSREGDQAYRLPLLLHQQDPTVFADDPFVRGFDQFNPHRGSLALLDGLSRWIGLSTTLATLFVLTFLTTVHGIERLAREVWPDRTSAVGLVAAALVVFAQAGNIGTNHLFEPILLDRLMAFALGWLAIAHAVINPRQGARTSALLIGLATVIHPSMGLQLALLLAGAWLVWEIAGGDDRPGLRACLTAWGMLALSLLPGLFLNLSQPTSLTDGLPLEDFRLLAAELQGPQHMLPHLWRMPQWLAFACYPWLALLALLAERRDVVPPPASPVRRRLVLVLVVNLVGLGLAWYGIERLGNLQVTVFQPFRMATIARGLCLVLLAGRLPRLWARCTRTDRLRGTLVALGLLSDWWLVVATGFETAMTAFDRWRPSESESRRRVSIARTSVAVAVLATGVLFLARHDTDSGHLPVLLVIGLTVGFGRRDVAQRAPASNVRWGVRLATAWVVPLAALIVGILPSGSSKEGLAVRDVLVRRCRFVAVPLDNIERLAVWCRGNTPESARFIGPPGPKTFRLWSRRSLAFNRAGSPYHAAGLADWASRFRDHVDFHGSTRALVAAYLRDRHALEARFEAMSGRDLAALARRQGAGYVVRRKSARPWNPGPLELLHVEGEYAAYRVVEDEGGRALAFPEDRARRVRSICSGGGGKGLGGDWVVLHE